MPFDILTNVNSALSLAKTAKTVASDISGLVSKVVDPNTGQTLSGAPAKSSSFLPQDLGIDQAREFRNSAPAPDLRVRLRAQSGQEHQVYGRPGTPNDPNILSILHSTQGVLFPYTPSIEWSQAVEYSQLSLTHANQDFVSYKNTPSTTIRVSGEFTVQNYREAQYMIAVIHFLRVVSKMFFGKPRPNYPTGMPPPVLTFSGYGNFMFNDLPVIVRDHGYSLGKEVDYVDVDLSGGTVRLPSLLSVSMSLTVQNTPKKLREEFNLNKFRTGELMTKKKGWI
jgi:hypothetical protein